MFLPVVLCGSVRASAAAGPTAPAGAVFAAVAHPSCCRSDAACTVACGAGDAIRWWQELVSGTWYEQATSGLRWILRDAGGGKWCAENDGTRYHAFGDSPVTGSAASTMGVGTQRGDTSLAEWFGFGTADVRLARSIAVGFPASGNVVFDTGGGRYVYGTGSSASADETWEAEIAAGANLSTVALRLNGSTIGTTLSGTDGALNTSTAPTHLGRWVGGGFNPVGRLYAACVLPSGSARTWLLGYMP